MTHEWTERVVFLWTHLTDPLRWCKQEFVVIVSVGWPRTTDNEHSVAKLKGTRHLTHFDIPVAGTGIDLVMTKMIFWSCRVRHMRINDQFRITFSCKQDCVGFRPSAPISVAASIYPSATRTVVPTELMLVPTCRFTFLGASRIGIGGYISPIAAKFR